MQPPSDEGKPGKITMKIGFITPFNPELSGLAHLGRQYLEGFQTVLEMLNNDDTLAVDFMGIERDSGRNPSQACRDVATSFAKSGVVAVIGGYRSICSMKAADVLGKKHIYSFTVTKKMATCAWQTVFLAELVRVNQ